MPKIAPDLFDIGRIDAPLPFSISLPAPPVALPPPPLFTRPEYIGQNLYIRPSYIVSLPEYSGGCMVRTLAQRANESNLKANGHGGAVSVKAIKNIRNAVNWLAAAAEPKRVYHKEKNYWFEFKLGFVTLTIPATKKPVPEKVFKEKLLNPWLTLMRSHYGLKNYVWKCELQDSGQIHCHITTDAFIHHAKIRSTWNKLLRANGLLEDYHTRYSSLSLREYLAALPRSDQRTDKAKEKSYHDGVSSGWWNPNSTDVHSVRSIKDIAAYICKYMAKPLKKITGSAGDGKAQVPSYTGRIWGCSQELSRASNLQYHAPATFCGEVLLPIMQKAIDYRPIFSVNKTTKLAKRIGEIFFMKYTDWRDKMGGIIHELFLQTIAIIRGRSGLQPLSLTV